MITTMRASTMVPSTSQTFSSVHRISTTLPVAHMRVSPVSRQAVKVFARTTKEKGTNAAKNNEKGFTLNPLGKGYDSSAREAPNPLPAFTRRREIWTGRIAMVGFAANVIAELFTGVGALGQIRIYTGLNQGTVDNLALAFVLFNFFTALSPGSDTFSEENQQDVRKRPTGPTQNPKINAVSNPKKFFGITNFGFTKKNELFVGRWAMLGFAAALIGEKLTSKGPLGQLGIPFDAPVNPVVASIGLAAWVGFFLVAAIGFGNYGQTEGDEGIY